MNEAELKLLKEMSEPDEYGRRDIQSTLCHLCLTQAEEIKQLKADVWTLKQSEHKKQANHSTEVV
jgi:hypothetical protein